MNGTRHSKKAIIIGCGIGGPVVAMALQRAGIEAVIYEAYDRPADYVGSFLNTASNGLDALRTLDSHTRVLAEGFATPRMVMWSGTGKRLGEVANGERWPMARAALLSGAACFIARYATKRSAGASGSSRASGWSMPQRTLAM